MSRPELFKTVKGAFVFLYLFLFLFCLTALLMATAGPKGKELSLLLALFGVEIAVALWSKRTLLQDLLEGRTESVRGRIVLRELGDSLRFMQVEYLTLDTAPSLKLTLFQSTPPGTPVWLDSTLSFRYLPRSKVIVQMEPLEGKKTAPRHRSKAWYQQKPRQEREQAALLQPKACRLQEAYWFWERLPLLTVFFAAIVLFVLQQAVP